MLLMEQVILLSDETILQVNCFRFKHLLLSDYCHSWFMSKQITTHSITSTTQMDILSYKQVGGRTTGKYALSN